MYELLAPKLVTGDSPVERRDVKFDVQLVVPEDVLMAHTLMLNTWELAFTGRITRMTCICLIVWN